MTTEVEDALREVNIIDFRDLTERFEELEEVEGRDEEEQEEYQAIKTLLDETRGYGGDHQWRGDWYPGYMIRDSYFVEYAQELADSIGAINREAAWPNQHIDWQEAVEHLQMDYTEVEYRGWRYWYR